MEDFNKQSEAEEIQTEAATVENETSTHELDAINESDGNESFEEKTEDTVPLSRLNKEVYKKHEARRKAKAMEEKYAELEAKMQMQNVESIKKPSLSDEDIDYDEEVFQEKLLDWKLEQREAKKSSEIKRFTK